MLANWTSLKFCYLVERVKQHLSRELLKTLWEKEAVSKHFLHFQQCFYPVKERSIKQTLICHLQMFSVWSWPFSPIHYRSKLPFARV